MSINNLCQNQQILQDLAQCVTPLVQSSLNYPILLTGVINLQTSKGTQLSPDSIVVLHKTGNQVWLLSNSAILATFFNVTTESNQVSLVPAVNCIVIPTEYRPTGLKRVFQTFGMNYNNGYPADSQIDINPDGTISGDMNFGDTIGIVNPGDKIAIQLPSVMTWFI